MASEILTQLTKFITFDPERIETFIENTNTPLESLTSLADKVAFLQNLTAEFRKLKEELEENFLSPILGYAKNLENHMQTALVYQVI